MKKIAHYFCTIFLLFSILSIGAICPSAVNATLISFSDPVGDSSGTVDVIGMDFTINEITGAYSIDISADNTNPFIGDFRININLFNVTRNEGFKDVLNDFNLGTPQSSIQLIGTNSIIQDWLNTDTIATTTLQG